MNPQSYTKAKQCLLLGLIGWLPLIAALTIDAIFDRSTAENLIVPFLVPYAFPYASMLIWCVAVVISIKNFVKTRSRNSSIGRLMLADLLVCGIPLIVCLFGVIAFVISRS